tara:strand:- start:1095 stop:1214 length:120 start_codon:yes stop_codon:yes gene_type:complete
MHFAAAEAAVLPAAIIETAAMPKSSARWLLETSEPDNFM